MKILHTSDWHLGHILYGYDRREEQAYMLQEITDIVSREKPDLFLLCGDVFHTAQPSAAVNKMFVNAIREIRKANDDMTIVIIAGNHDSGTRHEIFSKMWEEFHVHTIGTLHYESITDHIIEIPGKGFVVAIPYVHQRLMPEGVIQSLLDKVSAVNETHLPVIMTSHTTIRNSRFKGHEDITEFSVGGIDGIELNELGRGYDYLALGHIHLRQFVDDEKSRVRYSGSPMAVSFDEEQVHTISIIEINKSGELPVVREIEIINPIPLITIPSEGTVTWNKARDLLLEFPADKSAYLRLNVEVEDFLPAGASNEAYNITKEKKCRFCVINTVKKTAATQRKESFSVQEFKTQKPMDIFRRYVEETGIQFDTELQSLFREAMDDLEIKDVL